MIGLTKIWKDKDIKLSIKVRIVKALVFPVESYVSGSSTLNKTQRSKIEAFELWCGRRMLRIPWTSQKTSEYVLKVIGEEAGLLQIVMKMKLIFRPYYER